MAGTALWPVTSLLRGENVSASAISLGEGEAETAPSTRGRAMHSLEMDMVLHFMIVRVLILVISVLKRMPRVCMQISRYMRRIKMADHDN